MTILSIIVSGISYQHDASPEEVAALGTTRAARMEGKQEGDEGYIATSAAYLQFVIQAWADQQDAPSQADVQACIARTLASYAEQPAPDVPPKELSPEEQLASLIAYAAEKRWQKEVSGTTWNGHGVHTDRESQTKLTAAFVAIGANLRTDPSDWKFMDGFQSLTNVQMGEVVMAAFTHVNTCFATEAATVALINDGTITTKSQIDEAFA